MGQYTQYHKIRMYYNADNNLRGERISILVRIYSLPDDQNYHIKTKETRGWEISSYLSLISDKRSCSGSLGHLGNLGTRVVLVLTGAPGEEQDCHDNQLTDNHACQLWPPRGKFYDPAAAAS
jgi:hypothetical protein